MSKKIIVEEMTPEDHADFAARSDALPSNNLLVRARTVAHAAHAGQMRKDGKNPYIVHPERVVKLLQEVGVTDETVLAAAYLHDTLEDTAEDLTGFPEPVVRLVKELTTPKGTTDKDAYIAGFAHKSLNAVVVKLADRYDNLLDGSKTMSPAWVTKYAKGALVLLSAALKAGVNRSAPGAKLYAKLSNLRDRLAAQVAAAPSA